MGPNGAGKSTLSADHGQPGYEVLGGSVTLDGADVLAMPAWERAVAGLHLVMQYPTEVPGVVVDDVLSEALVARGRSIEGVTELIAAEAERIGLAPQLLHRALNVGFSGGEKKRNETLQLAVLAPKIAVLDELASGLDIDALRACAGRVEEMTQPSGDGPGLGVLVITHYNRLLRSTSRPRAHLGEGPHRRLRWPRAGRSAGSRRLRRVRCRRRRRFGYPDARRPVRIDVVTMPRPAAVLGCAIACGLAQSPRPDRIAVAR